MPRESRRFLILSFAGLLAGAWAASSFADGGTAHFRTVEPIDEECGNPSSTPIPRVAVVLTSLSRRYTREQRSGSDGYATFWALEPGLYRVDAIFPWFEMEYEIVRMASDCTVHVTFAMHIQHGTCHGMAHSSDTIEPACSPGLNALGEDELRRLPVNRNSLSSLVDLVPR